MGQTLFGGEVSGTPLETREGTRAIASDLLRGGGGRLAAASRGAVGFDPRSIGTGAVAERLLTDPRDRLRGLFSALEPFEMRQTEQAVEGVRGGFGRLGGRFSRNLADTETQVRGELAERFARSREQSLLDAEAQQMQTLGMLLQALLGARGQTLQFFQPGQPNFREGFLGDLISAGGRIGAAAATQGASV